MIGPSPHELTAIGLRMHRPMRPPTFFRGQGVFGIALVAWRSKDPRGACSSVRRLVDELAQRRRSAFGVLCQTRRERVDGSCFPRPFLSLGW